MQSWEKLTRFVGLKTLGKGKCYWGAGNDVSRPLSLVPKYVPVTKYI